MTEVEQVKLTLQQLDEAISYEQENQQEDWRWISMLMRQRRLAKKALKALMKYEQVRAKEEARRIRASKSHL